MSHRSLRLAAAYAALKLADTAQLVIAAHDALDDGVYSHSLGELATFRGPYRDDYHLLFGDSLRELGETLPDPAAAVARILEYQAVRLAEGAAAPKEVLDDLYSVDRVLRYGPPVEVPEGSLAALAPFLGLYFAVDEFHSYRAYAEYHGDVAAGGPGPEELYAEAVPLAARWCRDRWGPEMNPAWRTSSVLALCETIRTDIRFDLLPVLADALEDGGCSQSDILGHCRDPRAVHVRGCWVIDLVLSKE